MPAQNGVVGDDFGVDLPETQVDQEQLEQEKRLAKFVNSNEWTNLKDHLQGRINFYQSYLPDGRPLTDVDAEERGNMWVIANCVIGEFKLVIDSYEGAAQTVKEAQHARRDAS